MESGSMMDSEKQLLTALAEMCAQYLSNGTDGELDHLFMSAGENAISLLAKYGLVEPIPRGGRWTPAGRALLGWP